MDFMTVEAIEQKHGDLGGRVSFLRTRQCLGAKKLDDSPYAVMKVLPRTCSQNDRETPSKTQRHNDPLRGYFFFESKRIF